MHRDKTASLDISVGNRYQEGDYLAVTINWINKGFAKCIINIGDTLQRHTKYDLYDGLEKAHIATRKNGDKWLAANMQFIENLQMPYNLIRSDDWLARPEFQTTRDALGLFYQTHGNYASLIRSDIEIFAERQRIEKDQDAFRQACINYILEETTADIILGREQKVTHLYPGKWHQSYFVLMDDNIPVEIRGLKGCEFKRIAPSRIKK